MERSILVISSVTHALRGQTILGRHGIQAYIERNAKYLSSHGCGYVLKINTDPYAARDILLQNGIHVLDVREGGRL